VSRQGRAVCPLRLTAFELDGQSFTAFNGGPVDFH
jgi:hypothetical protein